MPRRFDHCVLCVHDLERAAATFEALGFNLTPVAQLLPLGVRNRIALFGDNFLELVAVADPAISAPPPGQFSFGAHYQAFLGRDEGMSMLAWHGTDARTDAQRFREGGCGAYAPFDFGRDAPLPSGETVRFEFSLAFATDPAMPRLAFFTCQQRHAPELFWRPKYQRHVNGTRRIAEVVMSAAEPERHRRFLERVSDGRAEPIPGGFSIQTTRGRLTMLDQAEAARRFGEAREDGEPRFRAVRLTVEGRAAAERLMRKSGIDVIGRGDVLLVPASACHGVAVEFFSEASLYDADHAILD
jgi:hypothetical protein